MRIDRVAFAAGRGPHNEVEFFTGDLVTDANAPFMLVHGSVLLDDVRPQSQGQRAGQFDRFAFSHWSNLLFDDAGTQDLDQLVGGVCTARTQLFSWPLLCAGLWSCNHLHNDYTTAFKKNQAKDKKSLDIFK